MSPSTWTEAVEQRACGEEFQRESIDELGGDRPKEFGRAAMVMMESAVASDGGREEIQ